MIRQENRLADNPVTTSTTDLAIVIVSWNTRQLLEDCLDSVFADPIAAQSEIWVVDNASTDGSPERVQQKYPTVRLVKNTENVGFARANNQAIRTATGRYVLLLNSDTVVPVGALGKLVAEMNAHSEAGVCSPMLLNADGTPQYCWAKFLNLKYAVLGSLDLGQSPYPIADFADERKRATMKPFAVDWVGGACFMVRATALPEVGLLDEDYFMYSEETDWCYRFHAKEHQVLLIPSVTVTHLGGGSSRAVPAKTRERMYRSALRFFDKTYGPSGAALPKVALSLRYLMFKMFKERKAVRKI